MLLVRRQKANSLNLEIYNVVHLLTTTITDILLRFRTNLQTTDANNCDSTIIDEVPEIIKYVNDCLVEIGTTYSCITMYYNPDLSVVKKKYS